MQGSHVMEPSAMEMQDEAWLHAWAAAGCTPRRSDEESSLNDASHSSLPKGLVLDSLLMNANGLFSKPQNLKARGHIKAASIWRKIKKVTFTPDP